MGNLNKGTKSEGVFLEESEREKGYKFDRGDSDR